MSKVQQQDILIMNKLYLQLKSYAAVARETGFAASTVKKYIIPDFVMVKNENVVRFDDSIERINYILPQPHNLNQWNDLMTLSNEEWEEIKELRKDMLI